jgi:hypothetical protein
MADHHLIATQDFGRFRKGQHITDDAEIEAILSSEHAVHVVRIHKAFGGSEPARPTPPALPKTEGEKL